MSKRTANSDAVVEYFKYRVRGEGEVVLARFHQFDQAMEFAGLLIARRAGANVMGATFSVAIEWPNDHGKMNRQTLTLTIKDQVVSA